MNNKNTKKENDMPRYIDADALIKKIFPYNVVDRKQYAINAEAIYRAISKAPTVDVEANSDDDWNSVLIEVSNALQKRAVKKAKIEVARGIFEEIKKRKVIMGSPGKIITLRFNPCKKGFEEHTIEGCIVAFSDIDELEKKYMEGQDVGESEDS